MEQLVTRKQRDEEMVWEFWFDVLFLRTGNGMAQLMAIGGPHVMGLLSGSNGQRTTKQATAATTDTSVSRSGIHSADTTTVPLFRRLHVL
jgi:hypothetical protein